jgi:hypothetical protein
LREYLALNRYRKTDGVTPLQYQRWLDLRRQLETAFPDRPLPGGGGETSMVVEYEDLDHLTASIMRDVLPVGLFADTPFAPERGTNLRLRVRVKATDDTYTSRMVAVSNHVGPGFSTDSLGMGLRFRDANCELREILIALDGPPSPATPDRVDASR